MLLISPIARLASVMTAHVRPLAAWINLAKTAPPVAPGLFVMTITVGPAEKRTNCVARAIRVTAVWSVKTAFVNPRLFVAVRVSLVARVPPATAPSIWSVFLERVNVVVWGKFAVDIP